MADILAMLTILILAVCLGVAPFLPCEKSLPSDFLKPLDDT